MTASISTPADLVNLSLARVGYKKSIGNLYDGSEAAKLVLRMYAQTRDEFLRMSDTGFCERNVVATLLKAAPTGGYFPPNGWNGTNNPPLPWMFEYQYPSDAIEIRSIRRAAMFVQNFDPQPNTFTVENDNYFTPPQRVILCNVPDATIVYTGQITDITSWDVGAVEAFAATLGRRLAPALMGLESAKLAAQDEQLELSIDQTEQG